MDLTKHIKEVLNEKIKMYEDRAYLISPLGRIAVKFGRKPENIMYELYSDDIQLMILNELYNNNINLKIEQDILLYFIQQSINNIIFLIILYLLV